MGTATLTAAAIAPARSVSPTWKRFRDAFRRHPTALIGGAILIGMIGMAIFAPSLGTIDTPAVSAINRLQPGREKRHAEHADEDGASGEERQSIRLNPMRH